MSGAAGMVQQHAAGLASSQQAARNGTRLRHAGGSPNLPVPGLVRRRGVPQTVAAATPARMSRQDMTAQMQSVRAQMEENEQLSVLMAGLRGSNVNDDDFAGQDVVMQLISISDADGEVGNRWLEYKIGKAKFISQLATSRQTSIPKISTDLLCAPGVAAGL